MERRTMRLPILSLLFLVACGGSGPGNGDDAVDGDDSDGDFITDDQEGAPGQDSDGDGTPDFQDDDSDDDGLPDYREAGDQDLTTPPPDHDGDGVPDFLDTDSDDNGRPDGVDGLDDADGDGTGNFADLDDDGDNLSDVIELGDDPGNPVDTDDDGTADFHDEDSDGDTIRDADDRLYDPDGDLIPAYRDLDSDDDCRPDAAEAGDAVLASPPVNSDDDTGADFIDLDSDNDGLLDSLEDENCNGIHDPPETSAGDDDSDNDGVSDLIEEAAGTNPNDPTENPQSEGNFVFVVPYVQPPTPDDDTLDFSTDIAQADVYFSVDTTGSMGGEITNLETSLSSIVASLAAEIPNIAIGVGGYDDFPTGTYGGGADQPFYLLHRVMTVMTGAGLSSVQAAVDALTTHNGGDIPESGWEAMHQIATGAGVSVGNANVPAFNPATAPPATIPPGESVGTLGGVGFRAGSLPIVVAITDAVSHDADYSFGGSTGRTAAINELNALGVRVIGVVSSSGAPRTDMNIAVNATGALVPVSAWDANRPPGCAVTQCCTGSAGAGESPVGGMCPLSFLISSNGSGLGTAVVTAIQALANFAVLDVGADIADNQDGGETVDAVAEFVDHLAANPSAPLPCAQGMTAVDTAPTDGFLDTFLDVQPGSIACFDVVPKMNTTVMPLDTPQVFTATITVIGDDITTLDTRVVYFLVPAEIPDVPVD